MANRYEQNPRNWDYSSETDDYGNPISRRSDHERLSGVPHFVELNPDDVGGLAARLGNAYIVAQLNDLNIASEKDKNLLTSGKRNEYAVLRPLPIVEPVDAHTEADVPKEDALGQALVKYKNKEGFPENCFFITFRVNPDKLHTMPSGQQIPALRGVEVDLITTEKDEGGEDKQQTQTLFDIIWEDRRIQAKGYTDKSIKIAESILGVLDALRSEGYWSEGKRPEENQADS